MVKKEPVCSIFLCDQKDQWQVWQTGQAAAPPTAQPMAWLHSGAQNCRWKASGRRAGTAVAFLPPVLHKKHESGVNIMGREAEAVLVLVSPSSTPPEKAYV